MTAPAHDRPAPTPAQRMHDLMRRLMVVMNQKFAGDSLAVMSKAGLSMPQMVTMYILERLGAQSISAIATKLQLSLAATSHLVDRLVRARLVVRKEEASDRRQKRVEITSGGRALLAQIHEAREREMGRVLARLSPRVVKDLEQVLQAMVEELSRESVTEGNQTWS
jgi:DNA-binding MarR family transcriptional regulator